MLTTHRRASLTRLALALSATIASTLALGQGTQPDVNVLFIQRTPRLSFVPSDLNYTSGLPAPGAAVTYVAYVRNWGAEAVMVPYEWWFDGEFHSASVVNIPAQSTVQVTFPWTWDPNDHTLEFVADPLKTLNETTRLNNRVEIRTNALMVGLWVEQSLYNYFHENQYKLGVGSNGFEDWGQRMVRRWNEMMSRAVVLGSDLGMRDRVALDKVVVVPDNALPLNGGYETNNPDSSDRTVDMQWGYPYNASDIGPGAWWEIRLDRPFFLDYGSIHEMNHARFHIDLYGFDTHQSPAGTPDADKNIQLRDDEGNIVTGTQYMPFIAWDGVYYDKWQDIMGGPNIYDVYSAMAWNWKHHKRGRGNMNAPADIGVFMQDLPSTTYLRLIDQNGLPLSNASVQVYQATSTSSWYGKKFDNTPDLSFTADANGVVQLPRCPFSSNGRITHTYGLSNGVMVLKVRYRGQLYFLFQESTDFNIQYWLGNTSSAYLTRQIDLRDNSSVVPKNAWLGNYFNGESFQTLAASRNDATLDFAYDGSPAAGVDADHFSVHWLRDMQFNEGWKSLTVTTDGGVQVLIDGRTVLDRWNNQGLNSWTIPTYTTSGSHYVVPGKGATQTERRLEVKYRHSTGQARLLVSFAEMPPEYPVPTDSWRADYFTKTDLTGYVTSRPEEAINFLYGSGTDRLGAADPLVNGSWSTRWTGDWNFAPSTYSFTAVFVGGVRVKVDGVTKVDKYSAVTGGTYTFTSSLDGLKRIVVEHNAQGSAPKASFAWTRVGRTVSGRLAFGDLSGPGPTSATFEFRRPGATTPFEMQTASLAADGSFTLSNAPSAQYDLAVKVGTWLRKKAAIDGRTGNTSGVLLSLTNGDVDGDNAVTVFDYNLLSDAFDTSDGDPGWNPNADLDGDGAVTVFDYNILSANFDLVGEA